MDPELDYGQAVYNRWTGLTGLDWWTGTVDSTKLNAQSSPDRAAGLGTRRNCTHAQNCGSSHVAESCVPVLSSVFCLLTLQPMAVAGGSKEAPISLDSSPGSVPVSPVKPVTRTESLAKCRYVTI